MSKILMTRTGEIVAGGHRARALMATHGAIPEECIEYVDSPAAPGTDPVRLVPLPPEEAERLRIENEIAAMSAEEVYALLLAPEARGGEG